jgi:hypothetical protein
MAHGDDHGHAAHRPSAAPDGQFLAVVAAPYAVMAHGDNDAGHGVLWA